MTQHSFIFYNRVCKCCSIKMSSCLVLLFFFLLFVPYHPSTFRSDHLPPSHPFFLCRVASHQPNSTSSINLPRVSSFFFCLFCFFFFLLPAPKSFVIINECLQTSAAYIHHTFHLALFKPLSCFDISAPD